LTFPSRQAGKTRGASRAFSILPMFGRSFANAWQKRSGFAEHWQNHPPRAFSVLPMLGKKKADLPASANPPAGARQLLLVA
jgi:hypothetical protein